jgi:hypothetical protein
MIDTTLLDEVQPDKLLSMAKAAAAMGNNPETGPDPDRPPTGGVKDPKTKQTPQQDEVDTKATPNLTNAGTATMAPVESGGGGTEYDLARGSRLRDLVAEDQRVQSGGGEKHPNLRKALMMGGALAPLAALPFIHGQGAAAGAAQGINRGVGAVGGEFRHEEDVQRQQHDTLLNKIQAEQQMENQRQMEQDRTAATERGMTLREKMAQEAATSRSELQGQRDEAANKRLIDTIKSREGIAGANRTEKGKEFEETRGDKLSQFQSTDQYRRWKQQMDNDTKTRIAQLHVQASQNKAPAAMMQTAVFAKGGLDRLASAEQSMAQLEASGVMGSLPANKVEDWIFGKGLVDPGLDPRAREAIGKMRAALGYTSSAAMRAHTGRTSREIYDDFKTRLGAGQDWYALKGAMGETHDMLYEYATSASDANIGAIRGGTNVPARGGAGAGAGASSPAPLTNFHVNPKTGERIGWNGKAWVPAPKVQ